MRDGRATSRSQRASTPGTDAGPVVVRMRRGSLILDLAFSAAGLAGFLVFRHDPASPAENRIAPV
jgi:hypothetical protein